MKIDLVYMHTINITSSSAKISNHLISGNKHFRV